MTAWENVIADLIDAEARQSAADTPPDSRGSNGAGNQNAAFPACRTAFLAPSWVLPREEQPDGDDVNDWREWMRARYRHKVATGHYADRRNALADVWSEAERAHHFRKGMVPEPSHCAGCGAALTRADRVMNFLDGAAAHLNRTCPDLYAEQCRESAAAGLVSLGLNPPK